MIEEDLKKEGSKVLNSKEGRALLTENVLDGTAEQAMGQELDSSVKAKIIKNLSDKKKANQINSKEIKGKKQASIADDFTAALPQFVAMIAGGLLGGGAEGAVAATEGVIGVQQQVAAQAESQRKADIQARDQDRKDLDSESIRASRDTQQDLQIEQAGQRAQGAEVAADNAQDRMALAEEQFDFQKDQSLSNKSLKEKEIAIKNKSLELKESELLKKASKIEDPKDLRKDYSRETQQLGTPEVVTSFNKIQAVTNDVSAAGDLALIFNYMKMLDPGSTVREGEFANAQNSGGVPDRIRAQFNKLSSGERLSVNQREDFLKQAGNLAKAQMDSQERIDKKFHRVGGKLGVDSTLIVDPAYQELRDSLSKRGGRSPQSIQPAEMSARDELQMLRKKHGR